ncbi:MAG TPA: NUDIX hydrolase [Saprospiraceae bacterium]|nr:NUDIX hydrolase [Saprospiraceae bacterium]
MSDWTTIRAKAIYDNPWVKISHREVKTPNDTDAIYGKVHFKNLAVGIIPVLKDGRLVLVGQKRYTLNEYAWEIPEGGCLLGDDPLRAAQRELLEETGWQANFWKQAMLLHTSNSVTDERAIIYLATEMEAQEAQPEHTEKIDLQYATIEHCIKMIGKGEISDAMSVSSILWYAQKGHKQIKDDLQVVEK